MMLRWERPRATLGLTNDYGYMWNSPLAFDDMQAEDEGPEPIDLGTLSRHGFQWRVGVFLAVHLEAPRVTPGEARAQR